MPASDRPPAAAPERGARLNAPRWASVRTASSTCVATGPSSTRRARWCSMARVAPTTVGLPASPHGPGPRRRAVSRVSRSGDTAARPSGSTLQGSQSRSATDSTAGSVTSTCWVPSSCSSSSRHTAPRSCTRRTPLAKGWSRSWASSGPTCPVSPSTVLRPRRTTSNGPAASSTAARARAVARVSEFANAGSQACRP